MLNRSLALYSLLVGLFLFVDPSFVHAAKKKKRNAPPATHDRKTVLVEPFLGPSSGSLRQVVLGALKPQKNKYDVVDAQSSKVKLSLPLADGNYVEAARKNKIHAFVCGTTARKRNSTELLLQVRNGANGEVLDEASWSAKKPAQLKRKINKEFWKRFRTSFETASLPPEQTTTNTNAIGATGTLAASDGAISATEPAEAPAEPSVAEEAPMKSFVEEPKNPVVRESLRNKVLLDTELGLAFFSRNLSYQDDISGNLRPYELGLTPAIVGGLDLFPGAFFTEGFLTRFGLTGSFARAPSIKSRDVNGVVFDTKSYEYFLGVKYRQPLGPVDVIGSVEYGSQWFRFEPSGTLSADVPNVRYETIRLGLGMRLELIRALAITARFAYLPMLSPGQRMTEAFPHLTGSGLEGLVGGAVRLGYGVELRLGLGIRHYGMNINAQPGDTFVARGISDQYVSGMFSIAYRWEKGPSRTPWIE